MRFVLSKEEFLILLLGIAVFITLFMFSFNQLMSYSNSQPVRKDGLTAECQSLTWIESGEEMTEEEKEIYCGR